MSSKRLRRRRRDRGLDVLLAAVPRPPLGTPGSNSETRKKQEDNGPNDDSRHKDAKLKSSRPTSGNTRQSTPGNDAGDNDGVNMSRRLPLHRNEAIDMRSPHGADAPLSPHSRSRHSTGSGSERTIKASNKTPIKFTDRVETFLDELKKDYDHSHAHKSTPVVTRSSVVYVASDFDEEFSDDEWGPPKAASIKDVPETPSSPQIAKREFSKSSGLKSPDNFVSPQSITSPITPKGSHERLRGRRLKDEVNASPRKLRSPPPSSRPPTISSSRSPYRTMAPKSPNISSRSLSQTLEPKSPSASSRSRTHALKSPKVGSRSDPKSPSTSHKQRLPSPPPPLTPSKTPSSESHVKRSTAHPIMKPRSRTQPFAVDSDPSKARDDHHRSRAPSSRSKTPTRRSDPNGRSTPHAVAPKSPHRSKTPTRGSDPSGRSALHAVTPKSPNRSKTPKRGSDPSGRSTLHAVAPKSPKVSSYHHRPNTPSSRSRTPASISYHDRKIASPIIQTKSRSQPIIFDPSTPKTRSKEQRPMTPSSRARTPSRRSDPSLRSAAHTIGLSPNVRTYHPRSSAPFLHPKTPTSKSYHERTIVPPIIPPPSPSIRSQKKSMYRPQREFADSLDWKGFSPRVHAILMREREEQEKRKARPPDEVEPARSRSPNPGRSSIFEKIRAWNVKHVPTKQKAQRKSSLEYHDQKLHGSSSSSVLSISSHSLRLLASLSDSDLNTQYLEQAKSRHASRRSSWHK